MVYALGFIGLCCSVLQLAQLRGGLVYGGGLVWYMIVMLDWLVYGNNAGYMVMILDCLLSHELVKASQHNVPLIIACPRVVLASLGRRNHLR